MTNLSKPNWVNTKGEVFYEGDRVIMEGCDGYVAGVLCFNPDLPRGLKWYVLLDSREQCTLYDLNECLEIFKE